MYNKWGGAGAGASAADGSASDDDRASKSSNVDFDRGSVKGLDETQQSWLLGAGEQKKKKGIDLGCVVISRRMCCLLVCFLFFCGFIAGFTILLIKTVPRHHKQAPVEDNYTQALRKALLFFDAQKSGILPKGYPISWRGNSGLTDGMNGNINLGGPAKDLVGGYYDAGDNIKFTFPTAFTITLLSWSVIEYKAKYVAMNELDHVTDLIKWGTDYILKTFNYTVNSTVIPYIYAQVGSGSYPSNVVNDHYCWERPETMDYARRAYAVNIGSDLAGEMSAAMAAASIVFQGDNPTYAKKLRVAATSLLNFAQDPSKRGRYSVADPDAANFYNSTGYWDEFLWANAWMYYATGNVSYLTRATNTNLANNADAPDVKSKYYGVFSWDNKLLGAQVLLTKLRLMQGPPYPYEEGLLQFNNQTDYVMCSYLPVFKSWNLTAGGLYKFNYGNSAPLQYNANAAFLATVFADYLTIGSSGVFPCGPIEVYKSTDLKAFARSQIDYILGKNPRNMSYIVGFGKSYPTQAHHRAASIPYNKQNYGCTGGFQFRDSNKPNVHLITGAMVAGPDKNDKFLDKRINYTYTEPSLAGNAGLTVALVALSEVTSGGVDPTALFSNLKSFYVGAPPPPPPWSP